MCSSLEKEALVMFFFLRFHGHKCNHGFWRPGIGCARDKQEVDTHILVFVYASMSLELLFFW